jgi:simple sugar transport system substrate-binding protein
MKQMTTKSRFPSRRQVLQGVGGVALAGTAVNTTSLLSALAADKTIIGFVYEGPRQDLGFNSSLSRAAKIISDSVGAKLIEQENVPATLAADKVIKGMIELDQANVVFATSFGYWESILRLAPSYPNVLFGHMGALWKPGDPKNALGYRGYLEEPHYLAGIIAARLSKTKKIGFVGAKPLYFIYNNCNALLLGARSIDPNMQCNAIITGDWNNPVKEAEAVNSLIDRGCDVIMLNADSCKVGVEVAERRGVMSCGYHYDLSSLAPKGFLTGAEWRWEKGGEFVKAWLNKQPFPNMLRGGFKENMVAMSPYGPLVTENIRTEVEKVKQGIIADTTRIYTGPLKDNKGNEMVAAGKSISNEDNAFKMSVKSFVEGVIG